MSQFFVSIEVKEVQLSKQDVKSTPASPLNVPVPNVVRLTQSSKALFKEYQGVPPQSITSVTNASPEVTLKLSTGVVESNAFISIS